LGHRLTQYDSDVLDRVVVIDLEVAFGADSEVHLTVKRELGQHMVKKTDACGDVTARSAVEIKHDLNPRFGRFTVNLRISNARRLLAHAASYTFARYTQTPARGYLKYDVSVSIQGNLAVVRGKIATACDSVGRDPSGVTLVAVSKFQDAGKIREAYDAGQRHFGESRLQEALPKIETLPADIVWHFIGGLQSNKARKIATVFDVIHAFCKTSQVVEADKACRQLSGLIEVNIADEPQKTGISLKQLDEFHAEVIQSKHVHFRGLMTIGPAVSDAEQMRPYFRELRLQGTRLKVDWLSMGMSADFEVAVQEGASHIRVGTAIFGSRQ